MGVRPGGGGGGLVGSQVGGMGWCGKCKKRRIRLGGQGGCDRRIEGDACCGRGGVRLVVNQKI